MASAWRHTSGGLGPDEDSNADLDFQDDGTFLLRICVAEMGNETQISMAQLTAKAMDVPYETIRLGAMETDKLSWGGAVMSSRGTFLWGHNAIGVGEKMVRAIKDFLARYFSCGEEEFDFRGGIVYRNGEQLYTLPELAKLCKAKGVKLTVHDYHRLPKTMWPREDCNENHVIPPKDYRIHDTNSYLTLAVAIKVDPVTKRIKVLKMIEAADIGTVINPRGGAPASSRAA